MYSLIIRPTAQVDLQGIIDYYDSINPKLGEVFLKEMEQAVHHIQQYPLSYQLKLKDIRVYFITRYNYGVYFKIYDTKIVVIAILNSSRNPMIWRER